MPPKRANRFHNVEDLYRRQEAEQMEQRINEKFNEGIEKLEKLINDMNQNRGECRQFRTRVETGFHHRFRKKGGCHPSLIEIGENHQFQ